MSTENNAWIWIYCEKKAKQRKTDRWKAEVALKRAEKDAK